MTNDYGFDYADCDAADGSDIWFTDAAGNVIPHEVDSWNANGDSFVWVKIPSVIPSTDASFPTAITMHWGDSAGKQTTEAGVWTGFAGVWHMNGEVVNGAPQSEPDATGHGLTAVPTGVANDTSTTLAAMGRTGGKVGNGRVNQTNGNSLQGLKVSDYSPYIATASKFTISGWWSATALTSYPFFICARTSSTDLQWGLQGHNETGKGSKPYQKMKVYCLKGDGSANNDWFYIDSSFKSPNWVYVTAVFDETTATVYSNGKKTSSYSNLTPLTAITTGFLIGAAAEGSTSHGWIGYYDEVRMHDGTVSADRVAADYATMNTPTAFLTLAPDVDTALWTGAAGDGDAANAGNWTCYDAANRPLSGDKLPAETTKLRSCTLSANADWTTLGFVPLIPDGSTIDLNGHDLVVSGFRGAGSFANNAAALSTLTLASASAVENTTMAIGGNLQFVKRGSGTFTSSKAQTYTGGTVVAQGKAAQAAGTAATDAYDATWTLFGTGEIRVDSGATYITQSNKAYRNLIVLNGGTLENSNAVSRNVMNIIARVTADSTITHNQNIIFGDGTDSVKCDMGGHTLTVKIAEGSYFQLQQNFTDTYGKIVLSGTASKTSGYLQTTDTGFTVNATNIDFEVGCRLNPKTNDKLKVRNYKQTGSFQDGYGSAATDKWLEVYGTFIPQTQYFTGCVMQNGSSIDLSGKGASWSLLSLLNPNNSSGATKKWVSFADGATVTLLLGARQIDKNTRIVAWDDTTRPDNVATLRFNGVLNGNTVPLAKRLDGLYLAQGFKIIVK